MYVQANLILLRALFSAVARGFLFLYFARYLSVFSFFFLNAYWAFALTSISLRAFNVYICGMQDSVTGLDHYNAQFVVHACVSVCACG